MHHKMKLVLPVLLLICSGWGFFSHRLINRIAVFTLPAEMIGFYKSHIEFIEQSAVNPDRRRYAVKGEAECHFIDLDHYPDREGRLPIHRMDWEEAVCVFGEDSLRAHGILPWNLLKAYYRLRAAFTASDPDKILRISADLGHYVGDANVPLHTTSNYDGQKTGQHGLHGFWESRLPELFSGNYDLLTGQAEYVPDVQARIWRDILSGHQLVDSVLTLERNLFREHGAVKFSYETRGKMTARVVSKEYAGDYHRSLQGMVDRRMRSSIKTAGDLWYTAWVEAGQPDLDRFRFWRPDPTELARRKQELEGWKERFLQPRTHEAEEGSP
ncbi:MAG: zinc dependent phospholipase C family protein [Bacteroidota bacterium]